MRVVELMKHTDFSLFCVLMCILYDFFLCCCFVCRYSSILMRKKTGDIILYIHSTTTTYDIPPSKMNNGSMQSQLLSSCTAMKIQKNGPKNECISSLSVSLFSYISNTHYGGYNKNNIFWY